PSGGTNQGSWQAGPVIPDSQGVSDAPAAMMVNGHVLCAVSPVANGDTESPTSFYDYDPVANAFTQVPTSNGGTIWASPTYTLRMLDLPDGSVLIKHSQGIGWRCPNRATIGSWDLSERIRHRVIEARRRLGVTVC